MSITKWVPVEENDPNPMGMGTWKWCRRVEVDMEEECRVTERVRAEAVKQWMNREMVPALARLRRTITNESEWTEEQESLLYDVARALGLDERQATYVAGDIDGLWRAVQDEV